MTNWIYDFWDPDFPGKFHNDHPKEWDVKYCPFSDVFYLSRRSGAYVPCSAEEAELIELIERRPTLTELTEHLSLCYLEAERTTPLKLEDF